jgi:hypothetical protein
VFLTDGTTVTSATQFTAASLSVVIRLRANNHAYNNRVWSTTNGGEWLLETDGTLALPTATAPPVFGRWTYNIPADILTAELGTPNPDLGDDWMVEVDFHDVPTAPETNETVVSSIDLVAQRHSLTEMSENLDRNADLTESQRGSHTWQNDLIIYVGVNTGDTAANGATGSRSSPFDNIDDAITAASNSKHPLIYLLADAVGATTVISITSTITVSKRYLFIRGPGRDLIVRRTNAGDVFNITGEGVELSGFQIETAATGSGRAVEISSADFVSLENIWINESRGDGVRITDSSWSRLHRVVLDEAGLSGAGHGIVINNSAAEGHIEILDCHLANTDGDGIRMTQAAATHCEIARNTIHGCTGIGIDIGANASLNMIHNNILHDNDGGDIVDAAPSGSNLLQNNEQWSKREEDVRIDAQPILLTGGETIEVTAVLKRQGLAVTTATSASITIRDNAGTSVYTETITAAPNAHGAYVFSGNPSPAIAIGTYSALLSITDAVGTVTSQVDIIGAPR